jgi:ribonuclease T
MLPIVVDLETSGLNPQTDAILEMAWVALEIDQTEDMIPGECFSYHVEPFKNAHIDPEALLVNHIDPECALRYAIPEQQALHNSFRKINDLLKKHQCKRAILVGHNVWFDLAFLQMAVKRCKLNPGPFHSFTMIDTATLSVVALGETTLVRAARAVGISFDVNQAHSAVYDAQITAELFCRLIKKQISRT